MTTGSGTGKGKWWVMGFLLSAALACADENPVPLLHSEIARLESVNARGGLNDVQRARLASLYFLTSRCGDVLHLLHGVAPSALSCSCGGACPRGGAESRLARLRRLVEKGAAWRDPKLQKAWREVSSWPEARYWALRAIYRDPAAFSDSTLASLRTELEKGLASLEVK